MPAGTPPLSNPLLLGDGTVIAHQSCTGNWWKLTPDIHFNYAAGAWAPIASMPAGHTPRFFSSAVLPDGRVIVEGGEYNTNCASAWTNKGSIYNPWNDSWDVVQPPSGFANIGYQSVVLANGTYLQANVIAIQAALLDPVTMTWSSTGAGKADSYDEESLTLLQNNKVLVVDAYVGTGTCGRNSELYNPATGAWSSAGNTVSTLADCQAGHTFEIGPAPLRRDGSVVAFGGTTNVGTSTTPIGIYSGGVWSAGPDVPAVGGVNYTLADAPAVVLPNNNILFAASPNTAAFAAPTHFFEMTPGNVITQVADNSDSAGKTSYQWNFLALPNGNVMALPTDGPNVWYYTSAWQFYTADSPVVTAAPVSVVPGQSYQIFGTQLNGKTQGAYYGDDVNAFTNYPIIWLYDRDNGRFYRPTIFNPSSSSVVPGESQSVWFTVPYGVPQRKLEMYVCASGVCGGDKTVDVVRVAKARTIDFNNDSKGDFLWQNLEDGTAYMWELSGSTVVGAAGWSVPRDWAIIGTGHFFSASETDILWRSKDGDVALWRMSGTTVLAAFAITRLDNNWSIVGIGDFDGDGKSDILWRHSDGTVGLWRMNGFTLIQSASFGVVDNNWKIVSVGDLNGDGKADILWRHTNGAVAEWFMNGVQLAGSAGLGTVDPAWSIEQTGDFNGDGRMDIVWRYTDGSTALWLMNGSSVIGSGGFGAIPLSWSIVNTGDFNGDARSDFLWRNLDGSLAQWFLNGTTLIGSAGLGPHSNAWAIVQ